MPRTSAECTFSMVVSHKDKVDVEDLIRNRTDFMGEPSNSDGCVVAMNLKTIRIIPRLKSSNEKDE